MPNESELDLTEFSSQVDNIHEQHLQARLRVARRDLSQSIEEFSRMPASSRLNEQVDKMSREVARLERELAVLNAQRNSPPVTVPTTAVTDGGSARPGEVFRQSQMSKAVEAIRSTSASKSPAQVAANVVVPTAADPAPANHSAAAPPQAETPATAAPAVAAEPEKTCPNCRRVLTLRATNCICGYSFKGTPPARSNHEDFLSKDEIQALRHGTKNPST
jgi:hypothetical protein